MAEQPAPSDVLAVFVKAPEPGRVKTRLSHTIGAAAAADLYCRLGRTVIENTIRGTHRTVVWYDPPEGRAAVMTWLEGLAIDAFHLQRSGGLGQRMAGTLARHFREGAERVVLIGSDCPGVDRAAIGLALDALTEHDLVLGPAEDGGFYLLAVAAPVPGLFRGVAWSTEAVLAQTIRNAKRLGLRVATLSTLRDVDTVEDAAALGWLSAAPGRRVG